MINFKLISENRHAAYLSAWLLYILYSLFAFPIFSMTVMLLSFMLVLVGAWLYGYRGGLLTTLLTIPYHSFLLAYFGNELGSWSEALNPIAISIQLLISGAVPLLKSTKDKLDKLNVRLEQRVKKRTQELDQLRRYIVESHDAERAQLAYTLLEDIRNSLISMQGLSDSMNKHLIAEGNPKPVKVARLNSLIQKNIYLIQNLKFIDYSISNEQFDFSSSIRKLVDKFQESSGTRFNLNIGYEQADMPHSIKYPLYRITHEAIANAVRHAKARSIQIVLRLSRDTYYLTVMNEGLPIPNPIEKGFGLRTMQQRAQKIGGSIDLSTTPGGLTCLHCSVPAPR